MIYLAREQLDWVRRLSYERVYIDQRPAGLLPQKAWIALEVEPGRHCIWGLEACDEFWVECRPNGTYLLRLREMFDQNDRRSAVWLFDDASLLEALIDRRNMEFVLMTEPGLTYLARKMRLPDNSQEVHAAYTPDSFPPLVKSNILVEKPLDKVNLQTDFFDLTGTLTIDEVGVHYLLDVRVRTSLITWTHVRDTVEIKPEDIVQLRFGSTRVTSHNPWVNIIYRTPLGLKTVSFTDTREAHTINSYNEIYAAIDDLIWRRDVVREGR